MWLLKILPAVEVLIFNSLSMDVCFKRKYPDQSQRLFSLQLPLEYLPAVSRWRNL